MDLKLFPELNLPSMRFQYRPEGKAPAVTAEAFAAWPEHMRREFALLVAEAGHNDKTVHERTGITAEALGRARQSRGLYARSFSEARAIEDDEVGNASDRASHRAGWTRRRLSDA